MKRFFIACTLLLAGCTSAKAPVCAVAQVVGKSVSAAVAVELGCSNQSAINDTIQAYLQKANVCTASASGPIGDLICPPLVSNLLSGALQQVPSAWGCSGGPLKDGASARLLTACKNAVTF